MPDRTKIDHDSDLGDEITSVPIMTMLMESETLLDLCGLIHETGMTRWLVHDDPNAAPGEGPGRVVKIDSSGEGPAPVEPDAMQTFLRLAKLEGKSVVVHIFEDGIAVEPHGKETIVSGDTLWTMIGKTDGDGAPIILFARHGWGDDPYSALAFAVIPHTPDDEPF